MSSGVFSGSYLLPIANGCINSRCARAGPAAESAATRRRRFICISAKGYRYKGYGIFKGGMRGYQSARKTWVKCSFGDGNGLPYMPGWFVRDATTQAKRGSHEGKPNVTPVWDPDQDLLQHRAAMHCFLSKVSSPAGWVDSLIVETILSPGQLLPKKRRMTFLSGFHSNPLTLWQHTPMGDPRRPAREDGMTQRAVSHKQ